MLVVQRRHIALPAFLKDHQREGNEHGGVKMA